MNSPALELAASWAILRARGWHLAQLASALRAHAEELGIHHQVSMHTLKGWLYRDGATPPLWVQRKTAELAHRRPYDRQKTH